MDNLIERHHKVTTQSSINDGCDTKHANVTKEVAIGFNNWVYVNRYKKSEVIGNEHLWHDSRTNYGKYFTKDELFDLYLNQLK